MNIAHNIHMSSLLKMRLVDIAELYDPELDIFKDAPLQGSYFINLIGEDDIIKFSWRALHKNNEYYSCVNIISAYKYNYFRQNYLASLETYPWINKPLNKTSIFEILDENLQL